jgi:hypothetical protein
MTLYEVHIYREMRLAFGSIEAKSHEEAAAKARDLPIAQADEIADCEGETFAALVDVGGDEGYEHSTVIDFQDERLRKAAPELLEALHYLLEQTVDMDIRYGITLTEGEEDARAQALAALAKATRARHKFT